MRSRRDFVKIAGAIAAGVFGGATVGDATAATEPNVVTLLNGRGAPRRRLGIVNDFYVDDATHGLYGPKRSSGWGRPTSLIGPAGPAGKVGPAGSSEPSGTGQPGPMGPRGYAVLHGAGAPAPSLGEDNDFYIDTSTTQLYGPREGGVWGSPVSLTGSANVAVIDGGTL
jgi:hypothetical protein